MKTLAKLSYEKPEMKAIELDAEALILTNSKDPNKEEIPVGGTGEWA